MKAGDGCTLISVCEDNLVVGFDPAVYRVSAIKKATYKFGDRFHALIRTLDNGVIEVTLKAKLHLDDAQFMAGEYCNEVLDQELREEIADNTQGIRNLLLAHAFSKTSLLNADLETEDYHAGPLNVGLPSPKEPAST